MKPTEPSKLKHTYTAEQLTLKVGDRVRLNITNASDYSGDIGHRMHKKTGVIARYSEQSFNNDLDPAWLVDLDEPVERVPRTWGPIECFWFGAQYLEKLPEDAP